MLEVVVAFPSFPRVWARSCLAAGRSDCPGRLDATSRQAPQSRRLSAQEQSCVSSLPCTHHLGLTHTPPRDGSCSLCLGSPEHHLQGASHFPEGPLESPEAKQGALGQEMHGVGEVEPSTGSPEGLRAGLLPVPEPDVACLSHCILGSKR